MQVYGIELAEWFIRYSLILRGSNHFSYPLTIELALSGNNKGAAHYGKIHIFHKRDIDVVLLG